MLFPCVRRLSSCSSRATEVEAVPDAWSEGAEEIQFSLNQQMWDQHRRQYGTSILQLSLFSVPPKAA